MLSIIREMQIQTMGFPTPPYLLLKWPKARTLLIPNTSKDAEQQEFLFIAGGNTKLYSPLGRLFGGFL